MRILFTGISALALVACSGPSGTTSSINPAPAPAPTPTPSPSPTPSPTPTPAPGGSIPLTGATAPVHDPAIIREGDRYFLFTTGSLSDREGMLAMRSSPDLTAWTLHGPAYTALPSWAAATVPGTQGMWAPDIVKRGSEYRLYFSVSTFGSNRSAIGMATATQLDTADPDGPWTDRGIVVQSATTDNFNAIDPAVFTDAEGREWMAFGSFWSGIKLIELDPATGLRKAGDTQIRSIASRPSPGAIEAPFVIRRGEYYYLFASFDSCCQGAASTYNTVVGRSTSPTGPYLDREGRSMMDGGGTRILESGQGAGGDFVGRGHVAVLQDGDQDYIVYHSYNVRQNGFPTLQIQRLAWSADGWPTPQ